MKLKGVTKKTVRSTKSPGQQVLGFHYVADGPSATYRSKMYNGKTYFIEVIKKTPVKVS
jgi:hypothetical protein